MLEAELAQLSTYKIEQIDMHLEQTFSIVVSLYVPVSLCQTELLVLQFSHTHDQALEFPNGNNSF
jgi:hypothetical protein